MKNQGIIAIPGGGNHKSLIPGRLQAGERFVNIDTEVCYAA